MQMGFNFTVLTSHFSVVKSRTRFYKTEVLSATLQEKLCRKDVQNIGISPGGNTLTTASEPVSDKIFNSRMLIETVRSKTYQ